MKAIAPITNAKLKRLAIGASSLVVASMTIGTTATAAASQHTDHKDRKKNQGSVQTNKNQRNTRNYNITYNINYYFSDRSSKSQKPPQNNKTQNSSKVTKSSTAPKSSRSQKDTKFAANHSHEKRQNRVFTETKWVYDPRLCRWVEIGFNKSTDRWELMSENDRKDSRKDNPSDTRNYSYWYND